MPQNTTLSRLLRSGEHLTLDGAMATELEALGSNLDDPLWSAKVLMEQPELIQRVHLDYFRAGAQVAITASYQATPQGFARRGLTAAEALELVALSVRLADQARSEHLAANPGSGPLLVAGSVGPYGAYLADGSEYRGDYRLEKSEFLAFHRPRIAALVEAGVDFLACETLPSLPEAEALLELLAEFDVEAWFSFTLRDGSHISDGTPLAQVAALCETEPRVVAVGVNCVPLELVSPALRELRSTATLPLLTYPNSGETYDAGTKTWGPAAAAGDASTAPATLQQGAPAWRAIGAQLLGGCCRTTPRDIAELALPA
ncbi:homocysteine S-methyltransferase [Pseudarthrobacter sp. J75]|uniref:homocysteine S-methyltransferase n=1 Tax=unclassified Pseudarthrobacter TaxID=2647000 RepID=UPI002E80ABCC|nr:MULTISPECIES: homocysteine S-methyltransferase [unclassified Pseudarthrobacter]MEE2523714.1 homocysteine S-methyltransferase [Pseudarthrobacter sp. J47]MEE2530105.1 homocysteine S-methyltransferase [Pseudarthrobacter sp. J75]MEE2570391.1 homocysteine S-methyltransferase [Pseudarthrobacter sp. J64]